MTIGDVLTQDGTDEYVVEAVDDTYGLVGRPICPRCGR